jgi:hypothetical protein
MRKSVQLRIFAMVLFALLAGAATAHAQATRTWVSGVGDDANPCSRTAPCKTFAGAISKTAPCGEIDVLDPGGFGAVTITKCISIEAEEFAGVLVSGTNAIIIQAGAGDSVVIRGITFEGLNTGLAAVKVLSAGSVSIESCWFNHFNGNGAGTGSAIDVEPGAPTVNLNLAILDTIIRNNNGAGTFGVLIKPAAGVTVKASLDRVRIESNSGGLRAEDRSKVAVSDSTIANNGANGVTAAFTSAAVSVDLQGVSISGNNNGIVSSGGQATVRISNVAVFDNSGVGLNSVNPGSGAGAIISFKNNSVQGNVGGDGAPTSSPGQI